MKKSIYILCVLFCSIGFVSMLCTEGKSNDSNQNFSGNDTLQTSEHFDTTFSIILPVSKINDTIQIVLPYTGGTGYSWYWTNKQNSDVLDSVSVETVIDNVEFIGSGGKKIWSFLVKKEGSCTIEFEYKRPWEKECIKSTRYKVQIE
ncbi:MAG: protease inhibitor I42 family protein [Bacteroidales bacterium]|nr:protease inhibitor I42 family protein [Bacteroidales bacterium]